MGFGKGHAKIGGREKGVKNEKTALLDAFAQTIAEGGMEKFQEELNKLSGQAYIYAYLQVFEYVKPKLSRTTVEGGDIEKPIRIIIQGAK